MDKKTVIAVIVSSLIIIIGFSIQGVFFSEEEESPAPPAATQDSQSQPEQDSQPQTADDQGQSSAQQQEIIAIDDGAVKQCEPIFNNGTIEARFSTVDAGIESFYLLKHHDDGEPINLIFKDAVLENPFTMRVGAQNGQLISGAFNCSKTSNSITFSKRFFTAESQQELLINKTYRFAPEEYFFELEIELVNSANTSIALGNSAASYTLFIGPQIGPKFTVLDNRQDYRRFVYYENDKRKQLRFRRKETEQRLTNRVDWVAINAKYFALVALPHAGLGEIIVSTADKPGISNVAELYLARVPIQSSAQKDIYQFYFGPRQRQELDKYSNAADNAFGVTGANLRKVLDSRVLIGWLESILKWLLTIIYSVVPNYGVAIIILTVIVRILTHPLTKKSQNSSEKLQALSPQVTELRQKYANDKQRLNVEIAELYKREKVNPAGGCLPILLQMPFFFAMFGIFNNHFELRGASFIMGWIDDLSAPESILNFGDFTLPLLGWNDLRLLPILYALTQLLSGFISKNPAQTQQQSRMVLLMPLILFFVLYNLPSGLLVYWVATNVSMIIQQLISKLRKKQGKA